MSLKSLTRKTQTKKHTWKNDVIVTFVQNNSCNRSKACFATNETTLSESKRCSIWPHLAHITSDILLSHCLIVLCRKTAGWSVHSCSSLALLSGDTGHESYVSRQVAAVISKWTNQLNSGLACSVASSLTQSTQACSQLGRRYLYIATILPKETVGWQLTNVSEQATGPNTLLQ